MLEKRKHNEIISYTRGCLIILVVIGHAILPSMRDDSVFLLSLFNIIYSFHMFAYFFLSGYLFQQGINKYIQNKTKFIIKKLKLLIIPYVTLTTLEYGILLIQMSKSGASLLNLLGLPQGSVNAYIKALFFNYEHYDTHLWFIYVLFFIFLINILAANITAKKVYFVFLVACTALSPLLQRWEGLLPIQNVLYWSLPFWIGRKFNSHNMLEISVKLKARYIILMGSAFAFLNGLLIFLEGLAGKLPTALAYFRIGICYELKHVTGMLAVLMLFWGVNRISKHYKITEKLCYLEKYSYDIYILHQPFLTVGLATVFLRLNINYYFLVIIVTILAITISIVFSKYVIKKVPILSYIILGNHNDKTIGD